MSTWIGEIAAGHQRDLRRDAEAHLLVKASRRQEAAPPGGVQRDRTRRWFPVAARASQPNHPGARTGLRRPLLAADSGPRPI